MKFAPALAGNLAAIERAAAEAARRRADVALFPECAVTGYGYDFTTLRASALRSALAAVGQMAATHRIHLLVGSPVFRRRRLYNCLIHFDRRGRAASCYAKCQLTEMDRGVFFPGDAIALLDIDGVTATTVICHERRYPELVRLAVMAGAQILFHPNAGMDSPAVSRKKRHGKDGIVARAFENAIYYVFANSVGPQGGGKWSAGDSKIVAPNERVLASADNQSEALAVATLDLSQATRRYPIASMQHPRFLAADWKRMVRAVRQRVREMDQSFDLP
jgi:predicted amidohydrolase